MKTLIIATFLLATACTSINRDTASEINRKQPLPGDKRAH